jgi:hypothetical protein
MRDAKSVNLQKRGEIAEFPAERNAKAQAGITNV